jgi:hypothetical protein
VAAFASDGKQADVAVVMGVQAPVNLLGAVFDEGWEARGTFRQSVAEGTAAQPDPRDVVATFSLRPGRYEIRLAGNWGDQSGTVFQDMTVPDFDTLPLAMSDLVVSRGRLSVDASDVTLQGLIAAGLTSSREFIKSERLFAFARVYQRGRRDAEPVTVKTRLISDQNQTVVDDLRVLTGTRFQDQRSVGLVVPIPLADLASGRYLLTLEANVANHRAERHLLFTVVENRR